MKKNKVSKVKDVAVSVKKGVVDVTRRTGQSVESIATLGLAGMAEDRVSKVLAGVGAVTVLVGATLSSKLVVFAGVGMFTVGFVRGFKSALGNVLEQQKVYDDVIGPHGEDNDDGTQKQ